MGLAEIAAGVECVDRQEDHGVATVDETGSDLADRLTPFADALPCAVPTATTVVEEHAAGKPIETAATTAGIPPITAAKTLHLLGVDGVWPLGQRAHEIIRDWLDARLSRSEARELTGATETEFQLATFIETHEAIDGAREAIEPALEVGANATTDKHALLKETMSTVDDLIH